MVDVMLWQNTWQQKYPTSSKGGATFEVEILQNEWYPTRPPMTGQLTSFTLRCYLRGRIRPQSPLQPLIFLQPRDTHEIMTYITQPADKSTFVPDFLLWGTATEDRDTSATEASRTFHRRLTESGLRCMCQ